jgi:arylsulfate sulfotransferase
MNMLVAGMRPNTAYHMRAVVQLGGGLQYTDPDQTFTTGSIPGALPTISATTAPGMKPNPGIELLMLFDTAPSLLATDLSGNVIWYANAPPGTLAQPAELLSNGDMLINWAAAPGVAPQSVLEETDLAGNVQWQLSNTQLNQALAAAGINLTITQTHHAVAVLPNGHMIVIGGEYQNVTNVTGYTGTVSVLGDALIDLDPQLKPVWTWSAFDHLNINYHPLGFPQDWTHCNAIIYSPTDGNLILSSRDLSFVMKIRYENGTGDGAVLWQLGPNGTFTLTNGGPSDWFYNQHYPWIVGSNSAGNFEMALWDNGDTRPDPVTGLPCQNSEGYPAGGACYSRGLLLDLDETASTAEIAWQDQLPLFALCCGSIDVAANGHVQMGTGDDTPASTTEGLEVTQTASPQTVWQMNVSVPSYRIVQIPSLYPGVTWNTVP